MLKKTPKQPKAQPTNQKQPTKATNRNPMNKNQGVKQDISRVSPLCTLYGKKKANPKYVVMVHGNDMKGEVRRKKTNKN